jgi:hypothetical protein
MFSLSELSNHIAAYKDERIPFSVFENWFEDNSAGAYDVPELKAACIAVDAALAEYHFDDVPEDRLKERLAGAVRRPFVSHAEEIVFVFPSRAPVATLAAAAMIALSLAPAGANSFPVVEQQRSVSASNVFGEPWADAAVTSTVPLMKQALA